MSAKRCKASAPPVTGFPAHKVRNRRKGKLAGIDDLPLDVLFEIFSNITPHDLLRIAKTSKVFRSFVLGTSARFLWQRVRENIPALPPPLEGMSEPAFINLVFENICGNCCRSTSKRPLWEFRIRYCGACETTQLSRKGFWERCGPYIFATDSSDEDEAEQEPNYYLLIPSRNAPRHDFFYRQDEYDSVKETYLSLTAAAEREAYVSERREFVKKIKEGATKMEGWATEQKNFQQERLFNTREERYDRVVARLSEAGWAEEIGAIHHPDSLRNHPLVKKAQKLSDRIWRNIEPSLTEFMEEMKRKRLQREYELLLNDRRKLALRLLRRYRLAHHAERQLLPGAVDFCDLLPVKDITHQPREIHITVADFDALEPSLPLMFTEWEQTVEEKLFHRFQICKTHTPLIFLHEDGEDVLILGGVAGATLANLKLATTVWACHYEDCQSVERPLFGGCGECHNEDYDDYQDTFDAGVGEAVSDDSEDDTDDEFSAMEYFFGCRPSEPKLCKDHDSHHGPPLYYPEVLAHQCLTWGATWETTDREAREWKTMRSPFGYHWFESIEFRPSRLRLDEKAGKDVSVLVEAVGLDPGTATAADMDALTAKFACLKCKGKTDEEGLAAVWTSGWREMIRHNKGRHPSKTVEVALIDPAVVNTANVSETELPELAEWLCMHCMGTPKEDWPKPLMYVKGHIAQNHGIDTPTESQDYCRELVRSARGSPEENVARATKQILRVPFSALEK